MARKYYRVADKHHMVRTYYQVADKYHIVRTYYQVGDKQGGFFPASLRALIAGNIDGHRKLNKI